METKIIKTFEDKLKGTIYGQAIGDALGLGTEGMTDEDMAWKYPNGIRHYDEIGTVKDGRKGTGLMTPT